MPSERLQGATNRAIEIIAALDIDDPVTQVSLEGLSGGALTSTLDLNRGGATGGVGRSVAALEAFYDTFRSVPQHAFKLQASRHTVARTFSTLIAAADEIAHQATVDLAVSVAPEKVTYTLLEAADELCSAVLHAVQALVSSVGSDPEIVRRTFGPLLQLVNQRQWVEAARLLGDMAWCNEQQSACDASMATLESGCPLQERWTSPPAWGDLLQSAKASSATFQENDWDTVRVGDRRWYRAHLLFDVALSTRATASCTDVKGTVHATINLDQPNATLAFYAARKRPIAFQTKSGDWSVPYDRV